MARDIRSDVEPQDLSGLGLYDFIPRVASKFEPPLHLDPLVRALEGAYKTSRRDIVAIPVRHGKTYTCLAAIAWHLAQNPAIEIMYLSYGANFAQRNSRKARRYATEAGVQLSKDHNTIGEWLTEQGGSVLATGIDGEITGRGADIIIIDDPIKSRAEAESPMIRDTAFEFISEAITRLNPGGSVFLVASRWHPDDPSGRLLATDSTWNHIHLRAIEDEYGPNERALWPEVRNLEFLKRIREEVKPYNWASLYQGEPKPRNSAYFNAPAYYQTIPDGPRRYIIGVDIAFSAGASSDYTAIVILAEVNGHYYVMEVRRFQQALTQTQAELLDVIALYPDAHLYSYVSGPEKGALDLLLQRGIVINRLPARFNKGVRAQRTAEAWGRTILVREGADWTADFLQELSHFTGQDDAHDDQVDALVSAFDAAEGQRLTVSPEFLGRRVM